MKEHLSQIRTLCPPERFKKRDQDLVIKRDIPKYRSEPKTIEILRAQEG